MTDYFLSKITSSQPPQTVSAYPRCLSGDADEFGVFFFLVGGQYRMLPDKDIEVNERIDIADTSPILVEGTQ